ncbi:gibberellin 20 oxidase 3-like [Cicer arietinum]|uniref:Gibberellin 20 oxidase 3-like n=1 Tax=Cicer arietinum TaxID=3827 RepID=A0A1S2YFN4_CICAR|nr:gibberellin 20 oxidase 3-like [Cicer arietinum]
MEVILVWFGLVLLFFLSFDYFGVVAIMKPENGNFSSGENWVKSSGEIIKLPLIDIGAIKSDEAAMSYAAEIVRKACIEHGAFEVTNIGVDSDFINDVLQETNNIFKLPLSKKISAIAKDSGFSVAHAERYTTVLPWKETFTFMFKHNTKNDTQVVDAIDSLLGEEFQQAGLVYQKYCNAMNELSEVIMELLAISLGVDRKHYQRFFEDAESMMRCNFYPPCSASLSGALGNGPHCDPISITILLQDQVGGLEIFADNKWLALPPKPNTLVINIGDTFMALTNGLYKSCLHRVLVSNKVERKSITFFMNPRGDKIVSPPKELLGKDEARKYPDYKWLDLYKFTQKTRRVDAKTLDSFIAWRSSSQPSNSN